MTNLFVWIGIGRTDVAALASSKPERRSPASGFPVSECFVERERRFASFPSSASRHSENRRRKRCLSGQLFLELRFFPRHAVFHNQLFHRSKSMRPKDREQNRKSPNQTQTAYIDRRTFLSTAATAAAATILVRNASASERDWSGSQSLYAVYVETQGAHIT